MSVIEKLNLFHIFIAFSAVFLLIKGFNIVNELVIVQGQGKRQLFQRKIIILDFFDVLIVFRIKKSGTFQHQVIKGTAGVVADNDVAGGQKLLHVLIEGRVAQPFSGRDDPRLGSKVRMKPDQAVPLSAEALL